MTSYDSYDGSDDGSYEPTGTGCGCGCGGACGDHGPGAGHDERTAPAAPYNPPGRTALDHRVGEYGDFLAALRDRLASPAYPALRHLTVRTPDDPALGLLDAAAVLGDLLTFHGERIADEAYLRTAHEHRSLVLLGRLVGHRPRPGVAASTHLAYTLDRDQRAPDLVVTVPRGARSHSVPASSDEDTQTFETSEDLAARWDFNELPVRRRRPAPLTPDDLAKRPELYVAGTTTTLRTGDQLLFVFGEQAGGRRLLLPVAGVRVDRDEAITAVRLARSAPPTLRELVEETARWIADPAIPGEPGDEPPTPEVPNPRPVSRLIEDFDEQVLTPLRADLPGLTTPESFAARLTEPHDRLAEAQVLAAPYEEVAAWFEELQAVLGELRDRAGQLAPSTPGAAPQRGAGNGARDNNETGRSSPPPGGTPDRTRPTVRQSPTTAALQALDAVLPALRTRVAPLRPAGEAGNTATAATGNSSLTARLLSALDPRMAPGLYPAWRATAAPTASETLRDLLAMRVTASPFGATAPLKSVQDENGRVVRQTDWPLVGGTLATVRIVFDTAGRAPVRAEFQYTETGSSFQLVRNLPFDGAFPFGPGRVELSTRTGQDHDLHWLSRRPTDSQDAGVTARLLAGLPERTLFVGRPEGEGSDGGQVQVAVNNGTAREFLLSADAPVQFTHGDLEVALLYSLAGGPPSVEINLASKPAPANRRLLRLDSVQDSITVGSWVAILRPRKGATDTGDAPRAAAAQGGIPGDPNLSRVTTKVVSVRTAVYTDYGITGRGTELVLADDWLDEHDVLLSHIRDAEIHAGGEPLQRADEPLGEDVHGNTIELEGLYDGLGPGRTLIVSGERSDIPGTAGVRATEVVVLADAAQQVDPQLPGDRVHTVLTLTTDLAYRYRRETVRILGNVVAATHGEGRDEPIGSGAADRANQTFQLWQSPLTWLPSDTPLGATPTLEVRVDGLLWHEVDSLAGRGPRERVYITGTTGDGRTTVTFGDGVHGARLPTGQENVRARYRFGTGHAANVAADRITQAVTRPLGVTAVTNPRPATGGADADGPALTRRTVPLAVGALDRLVSVQDYEDFARSRAGIGRAAARELFDGRRRILHVTVAGTADVQITEDSQLLGALRAALAGYGDVRLPVRVDARELVLLLLAARVKVAPDHEWARVEPRLRAALLRRLGFEGRELGQPAHLSEVLAAAQSVPGVDYVDVDVFTGVPTSTTAQRLADLLGSLDGPQAHVPARTAGYEEQRYTVADPAGETLSSVAARHGVPLAALLRLNPDITDTRRLAQGRSVFVFRGIRPAQLALLTPDVADTLILTEVK
ncbi:putative baseplate assembly protein [Streptomyces odontomachi]|uniref:putative baseplate assembly protein n=1 Tax=Streptomyces odontomachi TaxID=2944940 RepID=UPI00210ADEBC|nr:putative baseplate assembly protein [Streptomyces sp. ODS25]